MIRKILAVAVCVVMAFSVTVAAENSENANGDGGQEIAERQRREKPQGGNGRGERPPEGEMPQGVPDGAVENNAQYDREPQNNTIQTPEDNSAPKEPTAENDGNNSENGEFEERGMRHGGMPEEMPNRAPSDMEQESEINSDWTAFAKTYSTPITALILLGLAFVFVKLYKRKRY